MNYLKLKNNMTVVGEVRQLFKLKYLKNLKFSLSFSLSLGKVNARCEVFFSSNLNQSKTKNTIVEIVNASRDTIAQEFLFGDKIFDIHSYTLRH